MSKSKEEKNQVIKNNIFILKKIFNLMPVYSVFYFLLNILDGIVQFLNNILLIMIVVNSIQEGKSLFQIIAILVVYLIINIVFFIVKNMFNAIITPVSINKLKKAIQTAMLKKAISIDVAAYDDPNYYDAYILGLYDMETRVFKVLESLGNMIKSLISITSILSLVLLIDPLCILLVTVSIIITSVSGKKLNNITFKRKNELLIYDRKSNYIKKLFYLEEYAKEMRLSNVSKKIIKDYKFVIKDMKNTVNKYSKSIFKLGYLEDSSTFFFDIIYVFILAYRAAVKKTLSIGDFTGMLNAAWNLSNNIQAIVRTINEFHEHSIYIQKIRVFLNRENSITSGETQVNNNTNVIQLDRVYFSYPNNSSSVVNDVSFNIQPHEKVALVGYNGAGKTTLVKLLLRLYDASTGSIYENDIDIKKYLLKGYREKYGVVFQDFAIYATSLAENVKMDVYNQNDYFNIKNALEKIKLHDEIITESMIMRNMTKEFDNKGLQFSGGERQKIALARILYSSQNYIILDEPSAALDPESEYRFNNLITNELRNKSVIIISHRLSTTRMMDKIIMLENGRIVEEGSHDHLMQMNGKYAEMYKIQAQKYGLTL